MKTAQNFDNDDESTVQSFRLTQRQHQSTTNQSLRRRTASPTDHHHHSQIGWNVNEYLYEGARHAHLSMMLHGLALGAEKNYHHQSEHGRTPLIAAIRSVCFIRFHRQQINVLFLEIRRCCSIPSDQQCKSEFTGSRWSNPIALCNRISEERSRVIKRSNVLFPATIESTFVFLQTDYSSSETRGRSIAERSSRCRCLCLSHD